MKPVSLQKKRRRNKAQNKSLSFDLDVKNTPIGSFRGGLSTTFKSQVPVAFGRSDSISGPQMIRGRDGSVRIVHREYLFDILSTSILFIVQQTITVNPTLAASFPWLSSVAGSFEKFCFNKLCFHYVTQSSTSTPGSMMIIPCYNVDDNPPATKADALQFKDSVRSPAWQESCCDLPEDRLCNYKEYYTQINPSDQKLSVPANVFICTSSGSDASPIQGEVWVEYDILLTCPQNSATGVDSFRTTSAPGTNFVPANMLTQGPFLDFAPNPWLKASANYISLGGVDSVILQPGRYVLASAYTDTGAGAALTNGYTYGTSIAVLNYESIASGGINVAIELGLTVSSGTAAQRTLNAIINGSSATGPYVSRWNLVKVS
jgi:hypothetical protein